MEVIQSARPLSASILWGLQAAYYNELGPAAWNNIPYLCTSNACIARTYADMIVAFALDGDGPVTVLELGAGHGAFSCHLLRELTARSAYLPAWTYVMTDLCQVNVAAWKASGDFAAYPNVRMEVADLTDPKSFPLSGRMVVVANYVFDSVPCELYCVKDGRTSIQTVSLVKKAAGPAVPSNLEMQPGPLQPVDVPGPIGNVLKTYEGNVIFSTTAAEFLLRLVGTGFPSLVLSADKGFTSADRMTENDLHRFVAHDEAFSFMVNYHGLGRMIEQFQGGRSYMNPTQRGHLAVAAFGIGIGKALDYQLNHQFVRYEAFNHLYDLSNLLSNDKPPLAALLSFVELFNYDPMALQMVASHLFNNRECDVGVHADLFAVVYRCMGNTPAAARPETKALAGKLLGAFGYPLQALVLLLEYLKDHPEDVDAMYYTALSFRSVGRLPEATRLAAEALKLNPACQYVKGLCADLRERLAVLKLTEGN